MLLLLDSGFIDDDLFWILDLCKIRKSSQTGDTGYISVIRKIAKIA